MTPSQNRIILIADKRERPPNKAYTFCGRRCHTFSIQLLPKKRKPAARPVFVFLCFFQANTEAVLEPSGRRETRICRRIRVRSSLTWEITPTVRPAPCTWERARIAVSSVS